jgi:hypothetical protein
MLQLPIPVYRNYCSSAWFAAAFRAGRSGHGQRIPALELGGRRIGVQRLPPYGKKAMVWTRFIRKARKSGHFWPKRRLFWLKKGQNPQFAVTYSLISKNYKQLIPC